MKLRNKRTGEMGIINYFDNRERAKRKGLLLDEADWEIPTKNLRAIVKEENETITK